MSGCAPAYTPLPPNAPKHLAEHLTSGRMTTLLNFIRAHRLKPSEVMNRLQDAGIVSDNCVTVADVAECDQNRAVEWLRLNP